MHPDAFSPTPAPVAGAKPTDLPPVDDGRPWWRLLTSYHWFVLAVAALGWLFDCMDQQLFLMARVPALKALLPDAALSENFFAGLVTAIFIAGWATGGLIFGVLGDRIGRARVMMWTILIYSACTGLTALSVSVWDFALYRFLTGLGVGGEFAVGVALVAEVMPDRAGRLRWACCRPYRRSATSAPRWSPWASAVCKTPARFSNSPARGG